MRGDRRFLETDTLSNVKVVSRYAHFCFSYFQTYQRVSSRSQWKTNAAKSDLKIHSAPPLSCLSLPWVNHGHLTGTPKLSCVGQSQTIKGWWMGSLWIPSCRFSILVPTYDFLKWYCGICLICLWVFRNDVHVLIVFSTNLNFGKLPSVSPPPPWDNLGFRQALGLESLDSLGRTPLMHATFTRSAEAVVWLARRQAALGTPGCRTVYDYVCVFLFVWIRLIVGFSLTVKPVWLQNLYVYLYVYHQ